MTRLPVYDGTLDTPVGMVHLKDFALRHGFNGDAGQHSVWQTCCARCCSCRPR